eukprot:1113331_1
MAVAKPLKIDLKDGKMRYEIGTIVRNYLANIDPKGSTKAMDFQQRYDAIADNQNVDKKSTKFIAIEAYIPGATVKSVQTKGKSSGKQPRTATTPIREPFTFFVHWGHTVKAGKNQETFVDHPEDTFIQIPNHKDFEGSKNTLTAESHDHDKSRVKDWKDWKEEPPRDDKSGNEMKGSVRNEYGHDDEDAAFEAALHLSYCSQNEFKKQFKGKTVDLGFVTGKDNAKEKVEYALDGDDYMMGPSVEILRLPDIKKCVFVFRSDKKGNSKQEMNLGTIEVEDSSTNRFVEGGILVVSLPDFLDETYTKKGCNGVPETFKKSDDNSGKTGPAKFEGKRKTKDWGKPQDEEVPRRGAGVFVIVAVQGSTLVVKEPDNPGVIFTSLRKKEEQAKAQQQQQAMQGNVNNVRRLITMKTEKNIIDKSNSKEFTKTWAAAADQSWTVPGLGWPTFYVSANVQATMTAGYGYAFKVDFVGELEWDWRTGSMNIDFALVGSVEFAAYFELTIGGKVELGIDDLLKLGFTFIIPAGPVPIPVKPFIGASCAVEIELKAKFRLECQYKRELKAGIKYKRDADITLNYDPKTAPGNRFGWSPTHVWTNDGDIADLGDCAFKVYHWGFVRKRCRYFDFQAGAVGNNVCRCMGYQMFRGSSGRTEAAAGWSGYKMRKAKKTMKLAPDNGPVFSNNGGTMECNKDLGFPTDDGTDTCLESLPITFTPKLFFGVAVYYAFSVKAQFEFPLVLDLKLPIINKGTTAVGDRLCADQVGTTKPAACDKDDLYMAFPLSGNWKLAIIGEINANNLFPFDLGIPVFSITGNAIPQRKLFNTRNLGCAKIPGQGLQALFKALCCKNGAHVEYDDNYYWKQYDDDRMIGGGNMVYNDRGHDFVGYITDGYEGQQVQPMIGGGYGQLYGVIGLGLVFMMCIFWCTCCVAGFNTFLSCLKMSGKEIHSCDLYQLHDDECHGSEEA